MVCNITTLTHTLVGSAASAASELTTITVISVTGDCLRQRDNGQQQMRACTAKVTITQSCLRAKRAGQYGDGSFGTYHFFPAHCYFLPQRIILSLCSDMNCNVSVEEGKARERRDILTQIH